jgi:hypothetical protein
MLTFFSRPFLTCFRDPGLYAKAIDIPLLMTVNPNRDSDEKKASWTSRTYHTIT